MPKMHSSGEAALRGVWGACPPSFEEPLAIHSLLPMLKLHKHRLCGPSRPQLWRLAT
jgi:hypothetical protein